MKNMMKKVLVLALVFAFMIALAACGGNSKQPANSAGSGNDGGKPADGAIADMLGEYTCTGWNVSGQRMDGAGEWMKLESATRGIVYIAGKEYPFDWSISGNNMTIKEDVGLTYKATYEGGVITFDTGMLYYFEKK